MNKINAEIEIEGMNDLKNAIEEMENKIREINTVIDKIKRIRLEVNVKLKEATTSSGL